MHPTLAEVFAAPIEVNAALGRFTAFCNPLDMCAVALPAGDVAGVPFGVTLLGAAFSDAVIADLAARLLGEPAPRVGDDGIRLAVAGAHLSGQPLNAQLTECGARFEETTTTAPAYRLHALATQPPKPGLRRVESGGAMIDVEVWRLPVTGFARLVAQLPAPMAIGRILLADGGEVPGFLCEPAALDAAADITEHGGWVAYLEATTNA
jgi:allophanate hydrolase